MKTTHLIFSTALLATTVSAIAVTSSLPEPRPADRYQKMAEDWPFALATPSAPVSEPVKGWASNLYVGTLMRDFKDGKETTFVGVKARGEQTSFTLFGNEPNQEGISVGGIKWSEQIGKSEVTLKKGNEFATIKFDEQVLQTPVAPTAAVQQQRPTGTTMLPNSAATNRNVQRAAGNAVPKPAAIPQILPQATATPNSRPLPGNTIRPAGSNANAPIPLPEQKHRVRVIGSAPQ